jgi:uncharacterized membrane protein
MEFLLIALVLFALWVVLPLYVLAQNAMMRARLAQLEDKVERLGWREEIVPRAAPAPVPAPAPPRPDPAPAPPRPAPAPVHIPLVVELEPEPDGILEEEAARSESLGGLFERLVAGRLLIWLGGIALVLAAIFLIRYSIEVGLVTPRARMIGAALFGLALLAAGEYAKKGRLLADDPRIAQSLVGAGVAVLYATAYGSHVLYGLLTTAGAGAAMVAVTAAALMLSLRHGAPTAVMGLIGGFLTPLLVGSEDSSAVRLLAYLGLLDLAVFVIAWRRGWTWLAAAAVALSFVWTGYLLTRPPEDALAAGLFIILLALAASLIRPGDGRWLGLIQPLALGILQLAVLVGRTDTGLEAWGLFGLLSAACIALALLRAEYRLAPPVALGLALLLLLAKATDGLDPYAATAALGIGALFGGGGLVLAVWRGGALWTGIACAGLAGPALIMRTARPDLLDQMSWGLLAAALAIAPALIVWANRRLASAGPSPDPVLLTACASAALLAGVAVWDLAPGDFVVAGWLAVALATALVARRLDDLAPDIVALVAASVGVFRAFAMVPDLWSALAGGLLGVPVTATELPDAMAALTALALPAVLLTALHLLLPPLPAKARWALPALAGLFAILAAYVGFKQAFGLAEGEDFVARGMIERTILTQALFLLGWLLGAGIVKPPRIEPALARLAGTVLTALAAARLLWFDMIAFNPVVYDQDVGALPALNLILPAYLLSAFWLYAARRRADAATRSGFWLAAFLAALIAGVMLLVRQAFQGPILTGAEMPNAEFYSYSLAGILLAIALIGAGIRLPDKALRLAGLLLLTIAIVKVFWVDAAALEGLLRILSFFGLGIAAIGIGRAYGPVLRAERS